MGYLKSWDYFENLENVEIQSLIDVEFLKFKGLDKIWWNFVILETFTISSSQERKSLYSSLVEIWWNYFAKNRKVLEKPIKWSSKFQWTLVERLDLWQWCFCSIKVEQVWKRGERRSNESHHLSIASSTSFKDTERETNLVQVDRRLYQRLKLSDIFRFS